MCGLVSVISRYSNGFSVKEEDAFFEMLFADTLRGEDSTGIIAVQTDASFGIVKEALAAPYIIDAMRQEKFIKENVSKGKALIGHNRKATVGKVSAEFAHPFVVDETFAMVHNGTLTSHKHLADTTVDSEALAIHLSKVLNDDVTKEILDEALGKVYGAFAIIAYNQATHKVYAMRNKDRPLFKITVDDAIVLVSEAGLGMWCLSRNGIVKDLKVEPIKEHTLYTIDMKTMNVSELEFSPKKTWASTGTITPTGQKQVKTVFHHGTEESLKAKYGVSKSQYKFQRRKLLHTYMEFFVDDYVETDFPKTIEQGATTLYLLGENDSLTFDHQIHAVFDTVNLPEGETRITERLFRGRVYELCYNKETQIIEIYLDKVEAVPLSKDKNETKTHLH
jgi:glucosamine 6-phosphate synthetase-like amidotransferase/phosphosugar isomerase protein